MKASRGPKPLGLYCSPVGQESILYTHPPVHPSAAEAIVWFSACLVFNRVIFKKETDVAFDVKKKPSDEAIHKPCVDVGRACPSTQPVASLSAHRSTQNTITWFVACSSFNRKPFALGRKESHVKYTKERDPTESLLLLLLRLLLLTRRLLISIHSSIHPSIPSSIS